MWPAGAGAEGEGSGGGGEVRAEPRLHDAPAGDATRRPTSRDRVHGPVRSFQLYRLGGSRPGKPGSRALTSIASGAATGRVAMFTGGFSLHSAGRSSSSTARSWSAVTGEVIIVYDKNGMVRSAQRGLFSPTNSSIEAAAELRSRSITMARSRAGPEPERSNQLRAMLGWVTTRGRSGRHYQGRQGPLHVYGPALTFRTCSTCCSGRRGPGHAARHHPYRTKYVSAHDLSDPTPQRCCLNQQQSADRSRR